MGNRVGTAALASTAGSLLAVVAGIGAVSLYAEWRGVWRSYFLMERAIETVTPVVAVLGLLALLSGFYVVYGAR